MFYSEQVVRIWKVCIECILLIFVLSGVQQYTEVHAFSVMAPGDLNTCVHYLKVHVQEMFCVLLL